MKKKILLEALRSESLKKMFDDLLKNEDLELIGWVSRKLQSILMPFIDIYEEEDKFVIVADVAGFSKEDLNVKIPDNDKKMKLSGVRDKKMTDYVQEGRAIEFEKEIRLPSEVTGDGGASYEDGVLTIRLNKKDVDSEEIEIS